jgi:hypothetical protein
MPSIERFMAENDTIEADQSTNLVVSIRNASKVTITPDVGPVKSVDRVTVHPKETTSYTLTATGSGRTASATVVVTVKRPPPPPKAPSIMSFSANRSEIVSGQSVELDWEVDGARELSIDPDIGPVTGGRITFIPRQTTTYTLRAMGSGGSVATRETTVTVRAPAPRVPKPAPRELIPTPPPSPPPPPPPARPAIDSFFAESAEIERGQSVMLQWSTRNAQHVSIAPGLGSLSPSDRISVKPEVTTTYTLTAYGPGGEVSGKFDVTVKSPPPPLPPPPPGPQTVSDVYRCPNVEIKANQWFYIEVPEGHLQVGDGVDFYRSWSSGRIQHMPNGTQRVPLASKKPRVGCEIPWNVTR